MTAHSPVSIRRVGGACGSPDPGTTEVQQFRRRFELDPLTGGSAIAVFEY